MSEEWKDIEGYEGKYQVSNMGRIRSVDRYIQCGSMTRFFKSRMLALVISNKGYVCVRFLEKSFSVHRLVAKAFVPGYFQGAQVNHKDENKLNNRWDNLEWMTAEDNFSYGTRLERCNKWVEDNMGVPVEQLSLDGQHIATFPTQSAAARILGITRWRVQKALKGEYNFENYILKRKTN